MSTQQAPILQRGTVKQVLSGDIVIVRRSIPGKPVLEKQINISSINAPKLARRPTSKEGSNTIDEPFAWEAREFLRKKLVGREILFEIETKANNREYCTIYLGKDKTGENLTETLLSEGLVHLRESNFEGNLKLKEIYEAAKVAGKGLHNLADAPNHIRDIKWTFENPRDFFQSNQQKRIKAIIEQVRDGSTVRAFLLPDFHHITLMLSGIRCPQVKIEEESEPYAEEAKNFTEARLLQREVDIILETTSNQNFIGSILHPNGNIAEILVREGLARCVDWSITTVTGGPENLRASEKYARVNKLRLWKNYTPTAPTISAAEKDFQAKVIEVINGDALMLKLADDSTKKVFLSSIRPPRTDDKGEAQKKKAFRPLYDIPYMFEAREFLRKKIGGKKVNISIDYTQPASDKFPEKVCCTVTHNGINLAEALLSKGLATVVRYKQDDDQRSSQYDNLLAAELKAQKANVGLYNKKDPSQQRIVDLYGDLGKCKQFLPFFQRTGKMDVLVEFVTSGSRFRLYSSKDNCLFTLLLAGVSCPRAGVKDKGPGDPLGEEALLFSKDLLLQKTVTVLVESMDKNGNFIGWLWVDNNNLSVSLIQEGLASIHFSGERSQYYKQLTTAEEEAKAEKKGIWSNYEPPKEKENVEETGDRKVNYKSVMVSETCDDLTFYAQHKDAGESLEELLTKMRAELTQQAPPPHLPKKGELCAALFQDGLWYRAKIDKVMEGKVSVTYVDYGNKETIPISKVASLPAAYSQMPPIARLYGLAFVKLPKDLEGKEDALNAFKQDTSEASLLKLNVEYKNGGIEYVTLTTEANEDLGKNLLLDGLLLLEARRDRRLQSLVADYKQAEETAKKNRNNLWRYGDVTDDDATEFGR